MSKIYSTADVICSCDSHLIGAPKSSDAAGNIADDSPRKCLFEQSPSFRTHKLVDLLFCSHCHRVACTNCTNTLVLTTYCPSCMTEQTGSAFCNKNCFQCPDCSSVVTMVALNVIDDLAGPKCKVFKFKCTFCPYQYQTNPISKPRSLAKILASENPSLVIFSSYVSKYKDERALRDLNATNNKLLPSHAKRMSGEFLSKLTQLNLSNLTRKFASESSERELLIDRISKVGQLALGDDDRELQKLQQRRNPTLEPLKAVPLARRLVPKMAYSCTRCHHELVVPDRSPGLLKFDTRCDAIDVVPTIKVTKQKRMDNSYLIHVINPSPRPMKVTVSSFAKIPAQFVLGDIQIVVKLPVHLFDLNGRSELKREELLRAIPTAYLSESNPASRTALMKRRAKTSTNQKLEGFEEGIEQLENWVLLPMDLLMELSTASILDMNANKLIELNVKMATKSLLPLHLHVQSSNDQGGRLEYSMWTIITLN